MGRAGDRREPVPGRDAPAALRHYRCLKSRDGDEQFGYVAISEWGRREFVVVFR